MNIQKRLEGEIVFLRTKTGNSIRGTVKEVNIEEKIIVFQEPKEDDKTYIFNPLGTSSCKTVTVDFDSIEIIGEKP